MKYDPITTWIKANVDGGAANLSIEREEAETKAEKNNRLFLELVTGETQLTKAERLAKIRKETREED